jgi:hypothetical protein
MTDTPKPLRVLFCGAVLQISSTCPPPRSARCGPRRAKCCAASATCRACRVLGTLDDDETMVGTSPNGWPWTFYILADVPDRATVVAACNLFRTITVGEHRLWKYMRVEARIGRELVIPA